jgi:hypothetical protein
LGHGLLAVFVAAAVPVAFMEAVVVVVAIIANHGV